MALRDSRQTPLVAPVVEMGIQNLRGGMTKREAQRELDRVNSELNDLYERIRRKESERDKYDRIANPEDYGKDLSISIGDYS